MVDLPAQHDIELNSIPLMLYRAPSKRAGTDYAAAETDWGYGTVDAASRVQPLPVPRRWRDWSGGMGYAKAIGDPAETGVYHYGINVCTRFPGVVTPGGLVTPVDLPGSVTVAPSAEFEFDGDLYFLCGRYVIRLADGNGAPAVVQDLGASFTAVSAAIFKDASGAPAAYVGGTSAGASALIWEFDGTNWTQSANVVGKFLAVVKWVAGGVAADRLIVTDTPSSFKYTATASADPLDNADYSSAVEVGSPVHEIRSIARFPERVFFPKANGIHDVYADTDGNVQVRNITPYWEKQLDPTNGVHVLAARNHIYASFAGGLDRVDVTNLERQDEPEWCDVGAYLSNESPIYGTGPLALDRGWVVQAKYDANQGDTHTMYGIDRREVGRAGAGPMVWHGSEATIEDLAPVMLHLAAPGGNPRMWMSFQDDATPHLRWLSLPKAQSPLQDYLNLGPMRFAATAYLRNSDETWGAASDQKIMQWFTLQTRNLGGGALIDLYANAENGPYTGQGTARRSPRTRVTPREPIVTGYTIGTQIVLKSGASVPAILEELMAYAEVNPELAEQRRYPIVLARGNRTRQSANEYRVPESVWRLITPLQQSGPVTLKDPIGDTLTVNIHPTIGGKYIEDEDGDGWTRIANLTMTVLSRQGGRVLHWGIGERWAAGYVYGEQGIVGEVLRYGLGQEWGRGYVYGEE